MTFVEGDTILVDCVNHQLVFKKEEEAQSVEVEVMSS
jgi:ATP-dependent Clp protease ATP-binding subunit ClpB